MVDTVVSLGGFSFSGWGVPERINGGGKQRLAVHRLIGGGRVIDALGWDPDQIKFSGRLRGADASVAVRLVETIARVGVPVVFSYWTNRYQVFVAQVSWRFERFYEITYDLTLEVLVDLTQDSWQSANSAIDTEFSTDLVGVTSLSAQFSVLQNGVTMISSLQSMIGPLSNARSASVLPLIEAVAATSRATLSLMTSLNAGLPVAPAGGVVAGRNPAESSATLVSEAANYQQLSAAVQASAMLTRMKVNLGTISR